MNKAINFVKSVVIILILFGLILDIADYSGTHYNRKGVVVEVNSDEMIVDDVTGNEWIFNGAGYAEGDKVVMKMFTNRTNSNIYDDEIVNVKIVK